MATPASRLSRVFDASVLNPGVGAREVFAWAMYDFANSGYTTVVLTAVFSAYFTGVVAGGSDWGTLAWAGALAVSNVLVMLTMPGIGARTDAAGSRKRWLAAGTIVCVLATAALAFCGPGAVVTSLVLVAVSNYAYALGETLIAAFLPELARPHALGKVSGWGWSLGYCGGLVTLGLCLALVFTGQQHGETAAQFVPQTMVVTAAVYALAAIPTFLFLRERASGIAQGTVRRTAASRGALAALLDVRDRLAATAGLPDLRRLLAAGLAYQAGIGAIIALAAIYAARAMKFGTADTMALMFAMNIAAALGAFAFGYFEDRIGHRRALIVTLVAWIGMVALTALTTSRTAFWIAALVAGLCMGSSQSCGRAMVAAFAPPGRLGATFGLWAFTTRLATVIGPLAYGLVAWATDGNDRIAIWVLGVFFLAGLVITSGIDEARAGRDRLAVVPAGDMAGDMAGDATAH